MNYTGNQYCPVLGGNCKYMQDGKCTAAVCKRYDGATHKAVESVGARII